MRVVVVVSGMDGGTTSRGL